VLRWEGKGHIEPPGGDPDQTEAKHKKTGLQAMNV
jgi:hypothetical protein